MQSLGFDMIADYEYLLNLLTMSQCDMYYIGSIDLNCEDSQGAVMPIYNRTVTIGIPSYNEEENISILIRSIIESNKPGNCCTSSDLDDSLRSGKNYIHIVGDKQIDFREDFEITEIIVSDDSTDRTRSIVERIATEYPAVDIKLLHHDDRRGVSAAWNEIFQEAKGDIIVLYDADIKIDSNTTAILVGSIRDNIGLCASNILPLMQDKAAIARASGFIAEWLRWVRKNRLTQYTVMGRALSVSSRIAKKISIPENVIALDLYLQCRVLELGFKVVYDDRALVYFRPPDNMVDFSSQVLRATIGHNQIRKLERRLCARLPIHIGLLAALKCFMQNPRGAASLIYCYLLLPFYKKKLDDVDSAKWHVAKSTKRLA
jgi:cellulose synthase/poly-beta-1,6-N-acetylglucosamine synthase-like glycosyltransferase